jgi:hypothetical protein
MIGILAAGDNHFIVRGPLPDEATALALVRHWSIIQIGSSTPPHLDRWRISAREFREDLQWAVIVPGDGETSPAVGKLLAELMKRGVVPLVTVGRTSWSAAGPPAGLFGKGSDRL